MKKGFEFSKKEAEAIKNAVMKAEQKTAGEVVPVFSYQSDNYEESNLRCALAFSLTGIGLMALLSLQWALPFVITPWEIGILGIALALIGYLLSRYIHFIRKLFTSKEYMALQVNQAAKEAFLMEEIFNTKDRTGILIYISYFEHMVEIIGDSGINNKVEKKNWQEVVGTIIKGIKEKKEVVGIINGIELCGKLLADAGIDKPDDNEDELSNEIRIK